jgi:hypothetical protein
MASIRDTILNALVTRLASIAGWTAQLRGAVNVGGDVPVLAIVAMVNESKVLASSEVYSATLQVEVLVQGRAEDADATLDAGNPYRYLDRLVVQVEKKVHAPDSWGIDPDFTDVVCTGHVVADPDESNVVAAVVQLTFTYRHHYQDPAL